MTRLEVISEDVVRCSWKRIVDTMLYPANGYLEQCAYKCNGYNTQCENYTDAIGPGERKLSLMDKAWVALEIGY